VIAIIAFASSAVLLNAPPARAPARVAAESFAAKLVAAADLSIASGRRALLVIDPDGYRIDQRRDGAWAAADDPRFAQTALGSGVTAVVAVDAAAYANEPPPPAKAREPKRIPIDPLGAQVPFVAEFSHRSGSWTVSVDAAGEVRVAPASAVR